MLPKFVYKSAQVITRTPMRITLGGGGTDVIWYSSRRGGAWVSAAIDKYIYVAITPKKMAKSVGSNKNEIIRECLKITKLTDKIHIEIFSDVNAQSGLGGSGALEVGLLHALHVYNHDKFTKLQLAQEAADIEINRLQKAVGPQDQYIASLGRIKDFKLDKNGKISIKSLNLPVKTVNKLRKNLVFFATGVQKDTQKVLLDEKKRKESLEMLDKIKNLGEEAKKYLLSGKTDEFGKTLHQHWLLKKELSSIVSSLKFNEWYNEAIKSGALGGKIMGAGGGGWFVFYVNKNHASFIRHMVKKGLSYEKVKFDWEGTKLIKGN